MVRGPSRVVTVVAVLIGILGLAACTAAPSPTPTPTVSTEPTTEPGASRPTPTFGASCDEVVGDAELVQVFGSPLPLTAGPESLPFESGSGSNEVAALAGGLWSCTWGSSNVAGGMGLVVSVVPRTPFDSYFAEEGLPTCSDASIVTGSPDLACGRTATVNGYWVEFGGGLTADVAGTDPLERMDALYDHVLTIIADADAPPEVTTPPVAATAALCGETGAGTVAAVYGLDPTDVSELGHGDEGGVVIAAILRAGLTLCTWAPESSDFYVSFWMLPDGGWAIDEPGVGPDDPAATDVDVPGADEGSAKVACDAESCSAALVVDGTLLLVSTGAEDQAAFVAHLTQLLAAA